jgi:shikimate kinase
MQNFTTKWFIMGLPGSGKTTILNEMHKRLGIHCVDLDISLERQIGMTIATYWNFYGELSFRIIERQNLLRQITTNTILYACGGGTPAHFDNLNYMKSFGQTMYLNCSIPTLVQRLSGNANRPIFQKLSPLEIELKLKKLHLQRIKYFEQADIILNVDNDEQSVINKVMHILK